MVLHVGLDTVLLYGFVDGTTHCLEPMNVFGFDETALCIVDLE
jgi:hypothetical protein